MAFPEQAAHLRQLEPRVDEQAVRMAHADQPLVVVGVVRVEVPGPDVDDAHAEPAPHGTEMLDADSGTQAWIEVQLDRRAAGSQLAIERGERLLEQERIAAGS